MKVSKEEITMALDSSLPVNSIEENVYSDSKNENSLNILDTLSSNKDEANLITNKIAINKMIERAKKVGANALIGVSIDVETVGSSGNSTMSMLVIHASGTAAVVE